MIDYMYQMPWKNEGLGAMGCFSTSSWVELLAVTFQELAASAMKGPFESWEARPWLRGLQLWLRAFWHTSTLSLPLLANLLKLCVLISSCCSALGPVFVVLHPPAFYNLRPKVQLFFEISAKAAVKVPREQTGVIQIFLESRANVGAETMVLIELNLICSEM